MEDKNLIRTADKIQEALIKLKHSRYLELMSLKFRLMLE